MWKEGRWKDQICRKICAKSTILVFGLFRSMEECKGNLHVVITGSAVAPTPSLILQSIMGVVLHWAGYSVGQSYK